MRIIFQRGALAAYDDRGECGLRPDAAAVAARRGRGADRAMLDVVKLGALADRYPSELSGGQQQRAALARALVIEPETLLLDEPLSNLDAALREEMRFELRRLHDEYRFTTIYVTHDQAEAMTAADRMVVMNEGRVEQIGRPEEMYEKPRTEFVARFFGGANILNGEVVTPGAISVDGIVIAAAENVRGRPVRRDIDPVPRREGPCREGAGHRRARVADARGAADLSRADGRSRA